MTDQGSDEVAVVQSSASRRERKKLMRHAELLAVARRLIERVGFDRMSMEAIAADADVAVGTLYNYFPTKGDLLFAILSEDIAPIVKREHPEDNASGRASILALVGGCFEWFDRYDRALLKRFTADALTSGIGLRDGYFLFDHLLIGRVSAIVETMAQRGELQAGIDHAVLTRMVFNLGNAAFFAYLVDTSIGAAVVVDELADQLDMLWRGIIFESGTR